MADAQQQQEPPTKKKTVDEIWRELNSGAARAAARPVVPKSVTTGIPGFGIPGVQSRTRILPSKTAPATQQHQQQPSSTAAAGFPNKHLAAATGQPAAADHQQQLQHSIQAAAQAYDPAAAGLSQEAVQQYIATLQRTINCLSDPDRSTRRNAASSLTAKLMRGDAATPKASPAMLQALLSGPLLQPIANLLIDSVERCRATALQLLLDATPHLSDPGPMLTGLLPVLVSRMGRLPVEEPAEEVRLAAQELVQAVVKGASVSTLSSCSSDLALLLARGLEDAFPDAKRAAAAGLAGLSLKLPQGGLEDSAERLVQALIPNLSHQHSKVRLAALSGLRGLVLSGLPAGLLDSTVAPAVKPLTFDHTASVREAYYSALAAWLGCGAQQQQGEEDGEAHARCRTYAPVLLPLLLLGVSDPQPSIAAAALRAVEQAGDAWQQQQQQQQLSQSAALANGGDGSSGSEAVPMETDVPSVSQPPVAAADSSSSTPSTDSIQQVPPAAVAAAQLPQPYAGLPPQPCRQMVSALLPQLLPLILSGLREWTVSLRSAAARLLHTALVLSGPAVTPYLAQLLPGLITAMSDDDADVINLLASSCRVLGAFVASSAWLPLLVDAVADTKSGPASKANALVVLSCVTHAAAAAQQPAEPQLLQALVKTLASDEVLGCDHAGLQAQLLIVVENLLSWMPADAVTGVRQQLYLILLQLHGAATAAAGGAGGTNSVPPPAAAGGQRLTSNTVPAASSSSSGGNRQADRAFATLQQLAAVTGLSGGVAQLAAEDAQQVLPLLTSDVAKWGSGSHNVLTFNSLMQTAGPECLSGLLPQVAQVLQPILSDADREPALRLSLLQLLDGLLEAPSSAAVFVGSSAAADLTLHSLLLPPLVWRAGKSAAAVRFTAATALATFLSSPAGPPPADVLLAAVAASSSQQQQQQQQMPQPPGKARKEKGVLLLPLLAQLLEEDWYSDVRHTGCFIVQQLLQQVGPSLSDEARRAIYPELIKRLDDSSNKVRVAACAALVAFVQAAGSGYCDTNSGYLAAGVVLHMDDSDTQVAEAACQVLEALAAVKPAIAAAEVNKVRGRFRAQHYCDRVLAAAAAAAAAASI